MAPPCVEPACASKSDALRQMFAKTSGGAGRGSAAVATGGDADAAHATSSTASSLPCPPDRDELGKHSWTLVRARIEAEPTRQLAHA